MERLFGRSGENRYSMFSLDLGSGPVSGAEENPDPAIEFLKALKHTSHVSSRDTLALLEVIEPNDLARPWNVDTKMTFVECELDGAQRTLGTQCLIHLFDPGSGWIRDCRKRGDMLLMTAALVEKGVGLEGIFYYRGNPIVSADSVKKTVQHLITERNDDPSAILNDEIIKTFTDAGYDFSYPDEAHLIAGPGM
jgi:hypothetical protein